MTLDNRAATINNGNNLMVCNYQIRSSLVLLATCFAFLLCPNIAAACALGQKPTVLKAYENADVVISARAVAVEKVTDQSKMPMIGTLVTSTTMEVLKVFKGNLNVGDKVVFGQGNGISCTWVFYEDLVGKEYLFYLNEPSKDSNHWFEYGYSRSDFLTNAADDLLYLNKINKVHGRTRISGTYRFEDAPDDFAVSGRKMQVVGRNKVYETKTDDNGVYELYDLPPGKYVLRPEMPLGWKIAHSEMGRSPSYSDRVPGHSKSQIAFTLRPKAHAGIDVASKIDNVISGSLYDPQGKLVVDACPSLVPVGLEDQVSGDKTCENGHFKIESAPAGSYVLVLNQRDAKTVREPYPRSYYPNVIDRKKATTFTMSAGTRVTGLKMVIPRMDETVTISGIVRYADNKPAVKRNVAFEIPTAPVADRFVIAYTDSAGRFSMKVLKGLKGELYSGISVSNENFERCPIWKGLNKNFRQGNTFLTTRVIKFDAEHDLHNVVLRFLFPSCSRMRD